MQIWDLAGSRRGKIGGSLGFATEEQAAPALAVGGSACWSTKPPGLDEPSCGTASSAGIGTTSGSTPVTDTVKPYSPTETEVFLTCPMLWWYTDKQRWQSRAGWTPNRLIGNAVDAGLKNLWRGGTFAYAIDTAEAAVCKGYVRQDTWTLDDLYSRARQGVVLGANSAQLTGMSIIAVEPRINGRKPDLVLRSSEGLVVDDLKVSLSLDARAQSQRFEEYTHKWQFKDYAYHVQEEFGEPVTQVRVVQVVLSPRRHVPIHSIPMTAAGLTQWHQSAEQVWWLMHRMEQGLLQPWMNLRVCTDIRQHFGRRCEMYEGCHDFEGDTEKFSTIYTQKEMS